MKESQAIENRFWLIHSWDFHGSNSMNPRSNRNSFNSLLVKNFQVFESFSIQLNQNRKFQIPKGIIIKYRTKDRREEKKICNRNKIQGAKKISKIYLMKTRTTFSFDRFATSNSHEPFSIRRSKSIQFKVHWTYGSIRPLSLSLFPLSL